MNTVKKIFHELFTFNVRKRKCSFLTGVFTAEVNSVDENALPLDTFVQLPGEHSHRLFIRTATACCFKQRLLLRRVTGC
jgi:hypothetical protein